MSDPNIAPESGAAEDDIDRIPWTSLDAVKGIALLLGLTVFMALLIGLMVMVIGLGQRITLLTIAFLSVIIDFFVVWLFTIRKYGAGLSLLGLKWVKGDSWKAPSAALAAFIAVFFLENIYANLLYYLTRIKPPDQPLVEFFGETRIGIAIALLIAGFLAPLGEEIFFRGFVYTAFRRRYGVAIGIILSSVIFSAFHLSLLLAVPLFFIGVALAILYEKSGTLWASYIMHVLNNLSALIYLYFRHFN